ncbi:PilW family protein [Leifsonia sp. 2MCAF36]|uniref:PilW family protein n=1 Tax=Leifsonia sp. 2MCAF36 TaxID=3232988 RepID=UPI003F9E43BB
MNAPTKRARGDAGLTLVELTIAMALSVLLIGVAVGLFASASKSQTTISSRSGAATSAQQTMRSLTQGIENASEFTVQTNGSDLMLVARTASTGATLGWRCQAWYYQASTSTLRTTTTADGTKIVLPTVTQLGAWTRLATGVSPVGTTPVFQGVGQNLQVGFVAAVASGQSVTMQTTILQQSGVGASGTCY